MSPPARGHVIERQLVFCRAMRPIQIQRRLTYPLGGVVERESTMALDEMDPFPNPSFRLVERFLRIVTRPKVGKPHKRRL